MEIGQTLRPDLGIMDNQPTYGEANGQVLHITVYEHCDAAQEESANPGNEYQYMFQDSSLLTALQFDQQSASTSEQVNISTTSTSCETKATETPYDVQSTLTPFDTNDMTSSELQAVLFQPDEEPSSPLIQPEQTEHNPGPRDTKGRFKKKVSTTLKQAETRKKDRERKKLSQRLKIFDKFAKLSDDEEGFQFFSVFVTSNGDTHYAGTSQLVKHFQNNEPLLHYKDSMIESRTESIVNKLNTQRQKGQLFGNLR